MKKNWLHLFVFSFFLFSIEILFRVINSFEVFNKSLFLIYLVSISFSFLFLFFLSFIKKEKLKMVLELLFLLFWTLYACLQTAFSDYLHNFLSFSMISQFSATKGYINDFLASYRFENFFLFFPFLMYCILFFLKRKDHFLFFHVKERVLFLVQGLAVFLLFFFLFSFEDIYETNMIQKIGLVGYALFDLKSDSGDSSSKEEEIFQYFHSTLSKTKNDYTGYFEGKNLIVIMMESVNQVIFKEEYFPNFHKLLEHSWYWENNYSPKNSCATGDSEFSGMTSLYTTGSKCIVNEKSENHYFNSIFNLFHNKGYTTSSFHNFDSTYYKRDVYHINMGSDNFYDAFDLGIEIDPKNVYEWPSDVELIESAFPLFSKDRPFMAWITTVTTHYPYTVASTYGDKYFSLFHNTNYSDSLKRYLSKVKVLDDALGKLLEKLELEDILKDTVLVLYSDHAPIGLTRGELNSVLDYEIHDVYEESKTPFLIFYDELEMEKREEKTFYINLLPTIANLFALDYDSKYFMGEDLFDESFSNLIVYPNGSWEDKIAKNDTFKNNITYFDDKKIYSSEQIRKINQEIFEKKRISKLIIDTNFYRIKRS